jgi:hypothetical protein
MIPTETPADVIEYVPECSEAELDDVVNLLERWSQRTEQHVTARRKHDRHGVRLNVLVELVGAEPECFAAMGERRSVFFHVPARNISQSGVGLLAPPTFSPRWLSDMTPILRAETVLAVGTKLRLTIPSTTGPGLVMLGEVIRARVTHHGYVEAGVRFNGRALAPRGRRAAPEACHYKPWAVRFLSWYEFFWPTIPARCARSSAARSRRSAFPTSSRRPTATRPRSFSSREALTPS